MSSSSSTSDTDGCPESPTGVASLPSPSDPLLLLEGDKFYVSHDGVARTFYRMERWMDETTPTHESRVTRREPYCLEEFYKLDDATKIFVLREPKNYTKKTSHEARLSSQQQQDVSLVFSTKTEGVVDLGSPLSFLHLREIDQGVFGSAGTGATTWESSIAMSLFLLSRPHLLRGDVLELGSGIGLAGILCCQDLYLRPQKHSPSWMKSMVLTDTNLEVLKECRMNLEQIPEHLRPEVQQLDWYDFLGREGKSATITSNVYDTVLVSDCAYLYPDVVALSSAVRALLKRNDHDAKTHIFGPSNRSALRELIMDLQKNGMDVQVDIIEMSRYRLGAATRLPRFDDFADYLDDQSTFASKNNAKFLHVTASHNPGRFEDIKHLGNKITDID